MPKSFATDSSSYTAIKKRNVILNSVYQQASSAIKNGMVQVTNKQLGYENVSALYPRRSKNLIA